MDNAVLLDPEGDVFDGFETGEVTERELRIAFRAGAAMLAVSLFLFMHIHRLDKSVESTHGTIQVMNGSGEGEDGGERAVVIYDVDGRRYHKRIPLNFARTSDQSITVFYYPAYPGFPWYRGRANGLLFLVGIFVALSTLLVILTKGPVVPIRQTENHTDL